MTIAPYGTWQSPITAELIASGSRRLTDIAIDGDDCYWVEGRPTEGGRGVIVRRTADGRTSDINQTPLSARNRVHEYGGGAFSVADGVVFFSNDGDARVYRAAPGSAPAPLTADTAGAVRYSDLTIDRRRNRLLCVVEDHRGDGECTNSIGAISARDGELTILASGADFYSTPSVSPDEQWLAWQSWNHPNMPWDGSDIWLAPILAAGTLGPSRHVAGGESESVFQPAWSPDGRLHFVSDRNGWWNLYRLDGDAIVPVGEMAAEFGQPQWNFGVRTFGFESARSIIAWCDEGGVSKVARIDTEARTIEPIETGFTALRTLRVSGGTLLFVGSSPTQPTSVVRVDLASYGLTIARAALDATIDPRYVSVAESIAFPTEAGLTANGFYYAPRNPGFVGGRGEKPPLVVMSHGGPTSATSSGFGAGIQFFTSRGIAVLDVNYGGSTGYGRAYRQRLNGAWGIVDVDDCVNGALFLAARGDVDGARLAITGGSAGGYTTLAALAFRDVFKAGASHYGVSDLEALARDTHKFESRYMDSMVGPYPAMRDRYVERSPVNFPERLNCPVIFFQGLEDKVVPPDQAERMVEGLRKRGIPVEYRAYAGEQHGFRRAENIRDSLEAELAFYGRVFGFAEPV